MHERSVAYMKFSLKGINVKISDRMKEHSTKKIAKLERSLSAQDQLEAKFTAVNNSVTCELTLKIAGHFYRTEANVTDAVVAFDQALDLMERKLRKHKTRILKLHHNSEGLKRFYATMAEDFAKEEDADTPKISKHKQFHIDAMDEEEALLQMQLLGHSFFAYLNADSGKVNIIYARKQGEYGILELDY